MVSWDSTDTFPDPARSLPHAIPQSLRRTARPKVRGASFTLTVLQRDGVLAHVHAGQDALVAGLGLGHQADLAADEALRHFESSQCLSVARKNTNSDVGQFSGRLGRKSARKERQIQGNNNSRCDVMCRMGKLSSKMVWRQLNFTWIRVSESTRRSIITELILYMSIGSLNTLQNQLFKHGKARP